MIDHIISFCLTFSYLPCPQVTWEFVEETPLKYSPIEIVRQSHGTINLYTGHMNLLKDHWEEISFYQRRELIWHELAHLQGAGHTKRDSHIMNPHAPTVYWVRRDGSNWPYLKETLRECFIDEDHEERGH